MKYLVPFFVFGASTAFSCPNLSGKYSVCKNPATNTPVAYNLEISQKIVKRTHIFTLVSTDAVTKERETEIYSANGVTNSQSETDPETGAVVTLSTTVVCVGQELKAEMNLSYNGEVFSSVVTSLHKNGNQLYQLVEEIDASGEQIKEEVHCQ